MNKVLFVVFIATSVGALVLCAWPCGDTNWLVNESSNIGIFRNCTAGVCENQDPGDAGRATAAFLILACFPLASLAMIVLTRAGHEVGWVSGYAPVAYGISAVFILIAVATYGGVYNTSTLPSQGYTLGYSYGLACGALGLCLVGIVVGLSVHKGNIGKQEEV